ncbi:alpha-amylase family glycosyl hydrolase [Anaeromyxobacter oryzae]|nr:alpha-amylase family glycosyl hydrolase [Anaeromyxobacter oryzae]
MRPSLRTPLALAAALAALACASRAPRPPAAPPVAPATAAAPAAQPAPPPPRPLPQRPWEDEILYFVLVDRFADGDPGNDRNVDRGAKGAFHGGDLVGLTAELDEIASLGVTAIWVNPLVKNIDDYVTGAGFPDWAYHGYWMDDLSRLDARFGTEPELAAFVNAAHARRIRVLLDVVYNHCGYDCAYVRDPRTTDWLRSPQHGGCGDDDLTTCLAGLPDWKTERPDVRKLLLDAQLGWARRSGVDGFRLDTVKHVEHDFWQEHRRRVRAELPPGFFLLGEVWGGDRDVLDPWFEPDELDAGFDFGFQGSAVGWLLGRGRTVAYEHYLESRHKVRKGHLLSQFLSSHDVPGALHLLGGDRQAFRLAALLELTTVGIPVVYYGEEVARDIGEWPDNRSDMPWGDRPVQPGAGKPRDEGMRAWYRKLIALRRAHPALSRGAHRALSTEGDLLVFAREEPGGEAVVVAVNRGAAPASARVPAPASWTAGRVEDLLGGETVPVTDGTVDVAVPPRGARVLGVAAARATDSHQRR